MQKSAYYAEKKEVSFWTRGNGAGSDGTPPTPPGSLHGFENKRVANWAFVSD